MSAWPSPRLAVFVSSTIGECAAERTAARQAIESTKCEPVLFERTGARPHPARVTYLEGLSRSQICVIIWKESYGQIDPAIGISGIEDEFRIAREQGRDILLYIKSVAPNRDARLDKLIAEARSFLTTHSYSDESELQDQISSDITSLLSHAYLSQVSSRSDRLIDPSAVLSGSITAGSTALERPALEKQLAETVQQNAISWLVGAAGSGKTILLAQWAIRSRAAYVNARGLSLRNLLHAISASLSASSVTLDSISLEDAADNLRDLWNKSSRWPLVIDDPESGPELVKLLGEFGDANGNAKIVIGTRDVSGASSSQTVSIPGLSSSEVAALISNLPSGVRGAVSTATANSSGLLPLDIRKIAAVSSAPQYLVFDDVEGVVPDPKTRELLAFIVASPEPLTLGDLTKLSSPDETAIVIDGRLAAISFLLVDDGLGFRPVHDEIASDLRNSLSRRPALKKLVSLRLAQFFSQGKRFLPAFELYQNLDPKRALRVAYRAASQASMEGRYALAIQPMRFIADAKRADGARTDLAIALIALSQAEEIVGDRAASGAAIDEAEQLAKAIADDELIQVVQDQKLIKRVRSELRPEDLKALREVRTRYKAEGRISEGARLASEEGAILISVGDHDSSIPVLREARADFEAIGDRYGVYIATRNLIASLNMVEGGGKEAEQLLESLSASRMGGDQLRERAWTCNILARRYRVDGRLDEAIAVAREAIDIGTKLGDPYVTALNRIGLGNALRTKSDLDGALESFKQCGKEAQAINRKEIDGLASRLVASVLLQKADTVAPYLQPNLYSEAEVFATYVIGLLSGSIAEYQAAEAFDCRGDARMGLGKKTEALFDFAHSVKLFYELNDDERALSLLHLLVRNVNVDSSMEAMRVMHSALPKGTTPPKEGSWSLLLQLMQEGMLNAHPQAVGLYTVVALKVVQKITTANLEVGLWLHLLSLALDEQDVPDDGRMSFVLSAFLAHTRHRSLSLTQLTALTELTIAKSKAVHFHVIGQHLQISLKIGPADDILIVLDDIDSTPATRFLATALTCFFMAFRSEIEREFLATPMTSGTFIRCSILDIAEAPDDIRAMFGNGLEGTVKVATFEPRSGRAHELFIACRSDIQQRCQGDMMKASELQFMYADILRAVLAIVLGGDIESEVLRPKLVSLLKKTIQ